MQIHRFECESRHIVEDRYIVNTRHDEFLAIDVGFTYTRAERGQRYTIRRTVQNFVKGCCCDAKYNVSLEYMQ